MLKIAGQRFRKLDVCDWAPVPQLLDVDSPEDLRRYADRHHPGPPAAP